MPLPFSFATATEILFGRGQANSAPGRVAALGKRVLLVRGGNPTRSEALAQGLAVQALEVDRHQPAAERPVDVKRSISFLQDPQTGFGIFGDAPLIPAADLFEHRLADQAHRSGKDDGITLVALHHAELEEAEQSQQGNVARTSEALKVARTTLHDKLKKYGLI